MLFECILRPFGNDCFQTLCGSSSSFCGSCNRRWRKSSSHSMDNLFQWSAISQARRQQRQAPVLLSGYGTSACGWLRSYCCCCSGCWQTINSVGDRTLDHCPKKTLSGHRGSVLQSTALLGLHLVPTHDYIGVAAAVQSVSCSASQVKNEP